MESPPHRARAWSRSPPRWPTRGSTSACTGRRTSWRAPPSAPAWRCATRALVAGARAGRGAGPPARHRARAARRRGPGDRVQPALRRPGPRPGRRARRRRCRRRSSCAPIRTARSTSSSTRPSSAQATRRSPSALRAVTGRWPPRPRSPGGAGCRSSWCRPGTLNHFARDVGVYDLQEASTPPRAGQAVAVDLALVDVHPGRGDDPKSPAVMRLRAFLNTASIGSYPDLVRLREKWTAAVGQVAGVRRGAGDRAARRAEPVRVKMEGRWIAVWFLFVGNGPYAPRGHGARVAAVAGLGAARRALAARRPPLLPAARRRGRCSLGALGHSRVYGRAPGAGVRRGAGRCPGCSPPTVRWSSKRAATRSGWRRGPSRSTGATSGAGPGGRGRTWGEAGHGG